MHTTTHHPYLNQHMPIEWSKLTPETARADISLALQEAQKGIDHLSALPESQWSFETVFAAFDTLTEVLSNAWAKMEHQNNVSNSPEQRAVYNELQPKIVDFHTQVPLNAALWKVILGASEKLDKKSLTPTQARFVEETLADFRDSGADLPEDKKERIKAIATELAAITQKFSEQALDAKNGWTLLLEDDARLKGIPEGAKEMLLQTAISKGLATKEAPKYLLTLQEPCKIAILTYADDADLRHTVWEAAINVGRQEPYDNRPLIPKILALRQEEAEILGKAHFPDHILARRMAKTGERALAFVEDLHKRVQPAFLRDLADLEAFKAKSLNNPKEKLEPWDVGYWSEKLREDRYAFDEEALRPYFPVEQVQKGLFKICETLLGIHLEEMPCRETECWHPEVKLYKITNPDGHTLGYFYTDWHPRDSKRAGAWMASIISTSGHYSEQNKIPQVGVICGNLTAPTQTKPALLSHHEVETIFHEFGHLLHQLLGEVEIRLLNGTNVAWDFVELPSQIMENWCWERESLDLFARHYETNEPIPEELFQSMRKARTFFKGWQTMRQLGLSKMDLELHLHPEKFQLDNADTLDQSIDDLLEGYVAKLNTKSPNIAPNFLHLFSDSVGYASAYYSYHWAEVLDADAFTRFQTEGLLNPNTGRAWRDAILSRGNSADPRELFRLFVGHDPELNAFLKRKGLLGDTSNVAR